MSDNLLWSDDLLNTDLSIEDLVESESLLILPFSSPNHSITIGRSAKMDMCIDDEFFKSKRLPKCKCISKKHASVFYDEVSNRYELLNYSKFGTIVDNFYYGYDLKENVEENEADDADLNKCVCRRKCVRSDLYENVCEGSAILKHGSLISFGCANFVFIILDLSVPMANGSSSIDYSRKLLKSLEDSKNIDKDLIVSKWNAYKLNKENKMDFYSTFSYSKFNCKVKNENKKVLLN